MTPYYQDDAVTIYHADCRDVLPTLGAVDLVLTDPPYGINYVHGALNGPNASAFNGVAVVGDDTPFDPSFLLQYRRVILWGANHYADKLPPSGGWLVWDKRCNTVVNDQSDCEMAWTNIRRTTRIYYHVWDGFRRGPEKGEPRVHPTQKALGLMRWCLELAPDAGLILDPFMGSGTTLRAAKDLGRKAIGIEIEERYCEIAAKRMAQTAMALD
jgi:DNA modification methylase